MPVRLSIIKGRSANGSFSGNSDRESISSQPSTPLPSQNGFANGSTYYDDETAAPLLGQRSSTWLDDDMTTRRRRKPGRDGPAFLRPFRRAAQRCFHLPFCPTRPFTILFALAAIAGFVTSVTLFLMWYLNPDKVVLPWRAYCSVPPDPPSPPSIHASATDTVNPSQLLALYNSSAQLADPSIPLFPPRNLDVDWEALAPAGIFLGILTIDSAVERRMLARTTWAAHPRSRNGAFPGDGGHSTSRTIVRFVIGRPRKEWEQRVRLEQATYQDLIILDIPENMNSGKTHAYFAWAATNAWVPPHAPTATPYSFTYSDHRLPAPPLAPHDPRPPEKQKRADWTRPDFVLKADDDAFIMLAELEARLRIELHESRAQSLKQEPHSDPLSYWGYLVKNKFMAGEMYGMTWDLVQWVASEPKLRSMVRGAEDKQTAKWMRIHPHADRIRWKSEHCWIYDHPRADKVYAHGFLFPSEVRRVREEVRDAMRRVREAIRLGSSTTPGPGDTLLTRTDPPETDETTSTSPRADINTTLAKRVAEDDERDIDTDGRLHFDADGRLVALQDTTAPPAQGSGEDAREALDQLLPNTNTISTTAWYNDGYRAWFARTTVSIFGGKYISPVARLDGGPAGMVWTVEGLVEGSPMSRLKQLTNLVPAQAYAARESRKERYEGQRVGGTIAVHFIKKIPWYLETAVAFLGGDEEAEYGGSSPLWYPEL
ncbi:hypothetical protein EXIGLDRAFT_752454 [Exidia glandulosa HHB12029]|uniref:Glycosyltransferase family 31 protein n=1 Tax=Exidia glandulosa HHB12029 TaxID=1314781 RepID=A0A165EJS6_EXIGL|nr:hypothetical protein EXIGLDRAFT_752454 [Exidia glandulosa HHB12029]